MENNKYITRVSIGILTIHTRFHGHLGRADARPSRGLRHRHAFIHGRNGRADARPSLGIVTRFHGRIGRADARPSRGLRHRHAFVHGHLGRAALGPPAAFGIVTRLSTGAMAEQTLGPPPRPIHGPPAVFESLDWQFDFYILHY